MNKLTPAQLWPTLAPEWMLDAPQWLADFFFNFYKCFIYGDRYMIFIKGLKNTLVLTFFALLIGIALGIVVSLIRVTWDKNNTENTEKGMCNTRFVLRRKVRPDRCSADTVGYGSAGDSSADGSAFHPYGRLYRLHLYGAYRRNG